MSRLYSFLLVSRGFLNDWCIIRDFMVGMKGRCLVLWMSGYFGGCWLTTLHELGAETELPWVFRAAVFFERFFATFYFEMLT